MAETKHTILLVEDEADAALALGNALEHAGYAVTKAADGEQGLKLALSDHPDLILADLKMPKMNGMDMIKEIRKDEWGKKAEIIILTNVTDVGMLEEALSHDTFFYIVKSETSINDVIATIQARLK